MRLREVGVTRYGPLSEILIKLVPGLNVLKGSNESGKTLLVDAIIRMLIRGAGSRFDRQLLGRVGHDPEGYLLVEDQTGTEHKIPRETTLDRILGTTPDDLRNVFVIRNSDLGLSDDSGYLTHVQDRLTGLEHRTIEALMEAVLERAHTTPSGLLTNREETGRLRARVEKARRVLDTVGEYVETARSGGLDDLEASLVRSRLRSRDLSRQIESLHAARDRHMLEENRRLLSQYRAAEDLLEGDLAPYTPDVLSEFDTLTRELGRADDGAAKLAEQLQRLEAERDEVRETLLRDGSRHDVMREKEQDLKNLLDELRHLGRRAGEARDAAGRVAATGRGLLVALVMAGVSVAVSLLAGAEWWVTLASGGGFLLVALFFHLQSGAPRLRLAGLAAEGEAIASRARALGVEMGDGSPEVAIGSRIDQIREFGKRMDRHREIQRSLETRIAGAESSVEDLGAQRASLSGKLGDLKTRLGVGTRGEIERLVAERRQAENRKASADTLLVDRLGTPGDDPAGFWDEALARFERGLAPPDGRDHDPVLLEESERELSELTLKVEDLTQRLSDHRSRLADLAAAARQVLEADVVVQSTDGLDEVARQLEEFLAEVEGRRSDAMAIVGILKDLEGEERARVAELLGDDSTASRHFALFTAGRYKAVSYDPQAEAVRVRTAGGRDLDVIHLSQGTVDQLYMAIRLSLAERLLGGSPGFMILDDPFLTSDTERLQGQMSTLDQLARQGYTFLYLTVKAEVVQEAEALGATVGTLPPLVEEA